MYVRIQNTLNTYIICNIIKLYTLNAYHIIHRLLYFKCMCILYIYACIPRPEWQTWGGSVPYDLSRASIRCKGKAMFHPPASGRLPRNGEPPPKKLPVSGEGCGTHLNLAWLGERALFFATLLGYMISCPAENAWSKRFATPRSVGNPQTEAYDRVTQ